MLFVAERFASFTLLNSLTLSGRPGVSRTTVPLSVHMEMPRVG